MSEYLAPGHAPLEFHPFANLFPSLSAHSREQLALSLIADGQKKPVIIHKGMIIDGRARYELLNALGRKIAIRLLRRGDNAALKRVCGDNIPRLTERQRTVIERKLALLRGAT